MIEILGFTGTQDGMTIEQVASIIELFENGDLAAVETVHHGDCIGSDADMDWLCPKLDIQVVLHPGCNARGFPAKRANCLGKHIIKTYPQRKYLDRDQDIVDETEGLLATPKEYTEVLRSGTWATVRRARKKGVPVWIVYPDGACLKW